MSKQFVFGCVLAAVIPHATHAQFIQPYNPYGPPFAPKPPGPRELRAEREKAVAYLGGTPAARQFIETWGEDGVAVVMRGCTKPVALKLVNFQGLSRLARPRELLKAILQPDAGDEVVHFIMARDELADEAKCDEFLTDPVAYAMSIKRLGDFPRLEATKPAPQAAQQPFVNLRASELTWANMAIWGGGIAGVWLLFWWLSSRIGARNAAA